MADKVARKGRTYGVNVEGRGTVETVSKLDLDLLQNYTSELVGLQKVIDKIRLGTSLLRDDYEVLVKAEDLIRINEEYSNSLENLDLMRRSLNEFRAELTTTKSAAQSLGTLLGKQVQQLENLRYLKETGTLLTAKDVVTYKKSLALNKQRLDLAAQELGIEIKLDPLKDKGLTLEEKADEVLDRKVKLGLKYIEEKEEEKKKLAEAVVLGNKTETQAKSLSEELDNQIKKREKEVKQAQSLQQSYVAQLEIQRQLTREQEATDVGIKVAKIATGTRGNVGEIGFDLSNKILRKTGFGKVAERREEIRENAAVAGKRAYEATLDQTGDKAKAEAAALKAARAEAERLRTGLGKVVAGTLLLKLSTLAWKGALALVRGIFNGIRRVIGFIGNALKSLKDGVVGIFRNVISYMKEAFSYLLQVSQASTDLIRIIGKDSNRETSKVKTVGQDAVEKLNSIRELAESIEVDPISFLGTEETSRVITLRKQLGFSAEETGSLALNAKLAGINADKYLKGIENAFHVSQKQSTLERSRYRITAELSMINKKVLNTSKELVVAHGLDNKRLAESVMQASKLGLELQDVKSIADNLLDFESSIGNEMQAQLLTGKQLNLSMARLYALEGDYANLAGELARQDISAVEYSHMNLIQREAVAKALGMTTDQMAKMLIQQDKSGKLTDQQKARLMGLTEEQYKAVSLQESWNAMLNGLKTKIFPSITKMLPTIVDLIKLTADTAALLAPIITKLVNGLVPKFIRFWEDHIQGPLVEVVKFIVDNLGPTLNWIWDTIKAIGRAFLEAFGIDTTKISVGLNNIPKSLEKIKAWFQENSSWIRADLVEVGRLLGDWLGKRIQKLGGDLGEMGEKKSWTERIRGISNYLVREALPKILNLTGAIVDKVIDLATHWDKVKRTVLLTLGIIGAMKAAGYMLQFFGTRQLVGAIKGGGGLGTGLGAGTRGLTAAAGAGGAGGVGRRGLGAGGGLLGNKAFAKSTGTAVVILAVAAAVWVLSKAIKSLADIPGDRLWNAVGAVTTLTGALTGVVVLLAKMRSGGVSTKKLYSIAVIIGVLAGSVWLVSNALVKLAAIDTKKLWQTVAVMGALAGGLVVLTLAVALIGKLGPGILAGAGTLGVLTLAIMGIAVAMRIAKPTIDSFLDHLQDFRAIIESVGNVTVNILNSIWKGLSDLLKTMYEGIRGTIIAIGKNISDLLKTIFEGIQGTVRTAGDVVIGIIDSIGNVITSVIEGIGSTVVSVLDSVGNNISRVLGGFSSIIESTGTAIGKSLNGFAAVIRAPGESIKSAAEGLGTAFKEGCEGASTLVNTAGNFLQGQIDSILGGISEGIKSIGVAGRTLLKGDEVGKLDATARILEQLGDGNKEEKLKSITKTIYELATAFGNLANSLKKVSDNAGAQVVFKLAGIGELLDRLKSVGQKVGVSGANGWSAAKDIFRGEEGTPLASGGILPGNYYNDSLRVVAPNNNIVARVSSGEAVLNEEQQENYFRALAGRPVEPAYMIIQQSSRDSESESISELREELKALTATVKTGFSKQAEISKDSKPIINCDWDWAKFDTAYSRNISYV